MGKTTSLFLLGTALWASACADNTGPPRVQDPPRLTDRPLHQVVWAPSLAREFVARRSSGGTDLSAAAPSTPPLLSSYSLSFWAHASKDRSIEIDYRAGDSSWQPYLVLSIPKGSLLRRPDGALLAGTDSILITASIDTTQLTVRLEPTGLTFNDAAPAQLKVWYTGANRDFDANGIIDDADSYIEQALLGVWVQEQVGDPWIAVPAGKNLSGRLLAANLKHFSGYTVSW
ncbi:MAG: hypothetical protein HY700_02305 [Gemmatimonadetes bacterium]|nr:hypothetical protein [Gemmatimonadota bacterium]